MSQPESAALAEQHRQAQLGLRARALRDFLTIWPLWGGDTQSFGRLVQATMPLVTVYRQASSALAGSFYTAIRHAHTVPGSSPVQLAASLAPQQLAASMYVTAQVMTRDALVAGQRASQARETALVRVSGAVTRHVLNGGRQTVIDSVAADPQAVGWARLTDGQPCAFCAMLAGRGAVYKTEATADFQAHDACVLGTTAVSGPRFEAAFRRWHEGEVVVISVAGGDELSITPNHPVLTDRGWVEAGLLREGDEIIHRFGADLDALGAPHENDVPSPIQDVWGASSMDRLRTVPVAPEDFHGDGIGTQGNVDIKTPDGLFTGVFDLASVEFGDNELDSRTRPPAIADALAAEGNPALMLLGVAGSTHRCMSCGSLLTPSIGAQAGRMDEASLALSTATHTSIAEPTGDDGARNAVVLGDSLLGSPREIQIGDSGWQLNAIVGRAAGALTRFDPPPTESAAERLRVHSELGRHLAERLAGGIELRRIAHLRRIEWAGHVYNLQTAEGWYEANGIIVSNCGCSAVPLYKGSKLPALNRELRDLYNRAQREAQQADELDRGTSNDQLNAFRRLYEAEHLTLT